MSRTYEKFCELMSAHNEADEKWMPIQKAHELLDSVNEDEIWEQRHAAADALFQYIAELEAAQRWIPVTEKLPEDGEIVWLWDGNNLGMGYYLIFSGCFMDRDTPLRSIKPTHWMPLPQPPEVQE